MKKFRLNLWILLLLFPLIFFVQFSKFGSNRIKADQFSNQCWWKNKLGKFSEFSDSHSRKFSPHKREFLWSKNIFDTQSCSSRLIFSSIFSFTHTQMWHHFWGERASRTYFWPFLICCIWQCYRVFSVARIVNKALRSVFWVFLVGAARIIQRRKLRRSRQEKSWNSSFSKDHRIFQFLQISHQENESSIDFLFCNRRRGSACLRVEIIFRNSGQVDTKVCE